MPDLKLMDELGSDKDINLSEVKNKDDAKKIFDKMAVELADKEGIQTMQAVEKLQKQNPQLYSAAYGRK
jgi:hypothetical protein